MVQIKLFRKSKRLIVRFLVSYLLILLIPVCIGTVAYYKAINIIEEDALASNLSILQQTRDILDQRLGEVDSMLTQLALNPKVQRFMYVRDQKDAAPLYDIWDIRMDLNTYKATNSFIDDFYIFFNNSETVISPGCTYKLSSFYGYYYKYRDVDYKEWYDEFLNRYHFKKYFPAAPTVVDGQTKNMITCLQSIPLDVLSKQFLGSIMVLIDTEEIYKLLQLVDVAGSGYVYISDQSGNIVTSINKSGQDIHPFQIPAGKKDGYLNAVPNSDVLISYTTSSYNGWTYVAVLPAQVIMSKVNYIKNIAFLVAFFCICIGVVLSYLMAYRNTKPIYTIIKSLTDRIGETGDTSNNEYDFLRSAISKIIDKDEVLARAMEKQVPLLQAAFLARLIKGEFSSKEEIYANMAEARLDMNAGSFVVLLVRLNGYNGLIKPEVIKELNTAKLILKETVHNICGSIYVVDIDNEKTAFIMPIESENEVNCKDEVERHVSRLKEMLFENYNMRFTYACGNMYHDVSDMLYSFIEAEQALNHGIAINGQKILWYDSVPARSNYYYFPLDISQRLINMAKAGEQDEISKLMHVIYQENFTSRRITREMIKYLVTEIKGMILKTMEQIAIENSAVQNQIMLRLDNFNSYLSGEEISDMVNEVYAIFCEYVNKKKLSHNNRLKKEILQHLDLDYINPDLCLYSVATKFNLTEVYISHFFKEQVGENFSEYIEKQRINKACEILNSGNMSVDEIASQVGYNSAIVFRRAFKRRVGVTPTAYKDSIN